MYVTVEDLQEGGAFSGIIKDADRVDISDDAITNLIQAGKEIIDTYCGYSFNENIPHIVKVVNVQLLNVLLMDSTKVEESFNNDYSYVNNMDSYSHILKLLDFVSIDGEAVANKKNNISVRVI